MSCSLSTWALSGADLGDWDGVVDVVGLDGVGIDILGGVDELGAWDLLGNSGWVVDGLSACFLVIVGLGLDDILVGWDLLGAGVCLLDDVALNAGVG